MGSQVLSFYYYYYFTRPKIGFPIQQQNKKKKLKIKAKNKIIIIKLERGHPEVLLLLRCILLYLLIWLFFAVSKRL